MMPNSARNAQKQGGVEMTSPANIRQIFVGWPEPANGYAGRPVRSVGDPLPTCVHTE
jgi:hypothetical protein